MNSPMISVIIPVYNGEKYIAETVQSVVEQPYKEIEILLINDGSTDNSDKVCHELAKQNSNIRYFTKNNEGIGATRNFGIRYAQGKYLNFLDQDDVWVKDFLTDETAASICAGGDCIGFSYYNCNHNFTRGKRIQIGNEIIAGGGRRAVEASWQHHSSMFFKKSMLEQYGITYPETRHEDEIFRHKCLYVSQKFTKIDKIMFLYRNNPSSETHRKQPVETLFAPILGSWLELIKWHEINDANDKDIIEFCKSVFCMYWMESVEKLYQSSCCGLCKKNIITEKLLEKELKEFLESERNEIIRTKISNYYTKNMLFVWQNRMIGILDRILRTMIKIPSIRKLWETRKYPELISQHKKVSEW